MSDSDNVIKGPFPPPDPPSKARISVGLYQEVEQREDGPWLVVYAFSKKIGEVPIEAGTEPDLRYAKVIDMDKRRKPSEPS